MREAYTSGIVLLTGRFLGLRWNLVGRSGSFLPNFTLIGSGVWVYGPQNLKKWNFTNIIAPKGSPLHDSYKIYRVYARPQST